MMIKKQDITKQINKFVKSITFLWEEEALDGDETEEIGKLVTLELDIQNGNK